jgi:hypothetical protein
MIRQACQRPRPQSPWKARCTRMQWPLFRGLRQEENIVSPSYVYCECFAFRLFETAVRSLSDALILFQSFAKVKRRSAAPEQEPQIKPLQCLATVSGACMSLCRPCRSCLGRASSPRRHHGLLRRRLRFLLPLPSAAILTAYPAEMDCSTITALAHAGDCDTVRHREAAPNN